MANLEIRNAGEALQSKWAWFLLLGAVLIVCGGAAVALPTLSTIAASTVLGVVLAICGVVKIIEALQVKEWGGCVWRLLVAGFAYVAIAISNRRAGRLCAASLKAAP